MNITIGAWIFPVIATAILLAIMFRPYQRSGDYDFGQIFRLFWAIPIMGVWMIYFAILYFVVKP